MAINLPPDLITILNSRAPIRALALDLTITPNIFHFATRKLTIQGTQYEAHLIQRGDFQSFGGSPPDRISLQVQNIDKAMSAFFVTDVLESAPATVFWWFPEAEFKYTLLSGRVSLATLDGKVASFDVRSRFDPSLLKTPRRFGQALCPWATMDMFDDGPLSDAEANCPWRDEGIGSFTDCPGSFQDCVDRGMFDDSQQKYYFAGMPLQSAVPEVISDFPRIKVSDLPLPADLTPGDVIFQTLFGI